MTKPLLSELSKVQKFTRPSTKKVATNATLNRQNFQYTDWIVQETSFEPKRLHHRETVFTIGNGYLGTRGSFEESYAGAWPTTFIHGIYDDVPVVHTELANCPDWLALIVLIDGDRFRLDRGEIVQYQRQLDLKRGLLSRYIRWRNQAGHTVDIYFERFASLADPNIAAIRCQVTPIDFEGLIEVQASINGYPDNQGVRHWEWLDQGATEKTVWLHSCTRHSGIELSMATQLEVVGVKDVKIDIKGCQGYPTIAATFQGRPGETVTLDKIVTIFSTRETPTPTQMAQDKLAAIASSNSGETSFNSQNSPYTSLLSAHEQAWVEVWDACDVIIEGDLTAQIAIRYNLFQLIIAAPRHDERVSIPAKTLSGYAYRGHIFWDTEIFIVPFLTYTQPQIARNLLTYRYHTLPGARRKAQESGYQGALFPWESANSGDEVTPRWVPDAAGGKDLIRIWCGDIELHITSDVAYAVWHYWQATNDHQWMRDYGAELMLDTAVFWGCRVEHNQEKDRYEIRDVIGPDEYHDHVNNNAFTNRMVQWHLSKALATLEWLGQEYPDRAAELVAQLNLGAERLNHWADIIQKLWISQDPKTGLIEQCEGFFDLKDINLDDYEPRTRSMQSLLGIEGANAVQVLKQADVLMLLYLLQDQYDLPTIQANWNYYNPRTDHTYGSSLGPAIHGILACEMQQPEIGFEHFMRAALVDLEDVRGNAAEGIHAASAGGVWQAAVFGFGGISITPSGLVATPHLPPGWTRLKFKLQWRGKQHEFDFNSDGEKGISVMINGEESAQLLFSHPTFPPPLPILGVIFDLDGVLTDTAEYHYLAWQKLADEEGIPFDRQANEGMRGVARRESLLQMLGDRQVSAAKFSEMMERKNRYYLELIQGISPVNLLPGARELLADLRQAGIKIGIGSASKNARAVIQRLGIADQIDAIADGYSVEKAKPAPDLFLYAANLLGLLPVQCVVVEDATVGVEAAKLAGMWAIGLGPVERVGEADLVLPSLAGTSWSSLLTKLIK